MFNPIPQPKFLNPFINFKYQMKTFFLPLGIISMLAATLAAVGQTTVFHDTFASGSLSTLNPTAANPGTLSGTQTAYCIGSSKNGTGTAIVSGTPGALNLECSATSSGYVEAQALFTNSPITLNAAGQYIEVYYTFVDRTNICNGLCGNNFQVGIGLFNSGGSAPTNGTVLWNGGFNSNSNQVPTGACQNWVGYNAQFAFSSNSVQSSAIGSRPAQTGANNLNQGLGYNSGYASGANVTTMAGVVGQPLLTVGSQYTMDLRISYVNATTLAITNTLYNGAGNGGTVYSAGGWTGQFGATATFNTNSFSGLVIDYRPSSSPQTTNQITGVTVISYIPAAPTIAGLTNQTVIQASNATLSATILGTPAPTLQWYYATSAGAASNAIAGATSSSLTLANVQYSQNGYVYYLYASNSVGILTSNMTLSVIVPPSITGLSSTASASVGSTVAFSPSVSGVPAPALQWQTNGVNLSDGSDGHGSIIAGSQTSTLNITNAQAADSATYSLIASNSAGIVTNSVALTVSSANFLPSFAGPYNQTNFQGSTATFTVTSVSGAPAPTLQWLDQTQTPISGQTGTSLVLNNVQYSQNGYTYYLVASNSVGSVTNGATLTVIVPPSIVNQPTNLVVTNTQMASFTVVETNGEPIPTYQWYKNSSPISSAVNPSATNATLTIVSAAPTDAANYYVNISNSAGTTNSATVTLTVNSTMSVAVLLPSNSQTGVCYDTPLYITFSSTPTLRAAGTIKIYNSTNSTTPVDTVDLSQCVTNNIAYAANVQPYTIGGGTGFTNFPVIIAGTTAAIYPHHGLLNSNQTYYVTVDSGTFTDSAGANFAGITATNAWRFTTKPTGPAVATNLVVAQDYSGDFATVQGAIDFIANANTTPTIINIRNGTYTEVVNINQKNNIDLRGQNRTNTIIGYANNSNVSGSTHLRMAFKVNGNDITLENLTVTNMTPQGGSQAEALMIEGNSVASAAKRCIINNCTLASRQDTILANINASQGYFYNSLIMGNFDYVWGGGNIFFTNCEIRTIGGVDSPNLSAARTDNGTNGNWLGYNGLYASNGISFVNCQLTRQDSTVVNCSMADANGATNGNVAWIGCSIDTACYTNATAPAQGSQLLWEYGCSNLNNTVALNNSAFPFLSFVQLTNNDPRLLAAGNVTTWMNGWTPALAPNIISQPIGQTQNAGATAIFTAVATGIPAPAYQWLKGGAAIVWQTGSSLSLANISAADAASYSVVVSNASGVVTSSVASLTVNKTTPVLSVIAGAITYGQMLGSSDLSASAATNSVNQAPVAGTFYFASPSIVPSVGTTNVAVYFSPSDTASYNYVTNNVTVTVNKGNSSVTVTGTTGFTYNGAGQGPASVSVTGSSSEVSYSYAGVSVSYGPSANVPTNAGSYTVTATVAADSNYNGASSSATSFTISVQSASVTANAKSKTYGALNPVLTATVGGIVNGDVLNFSLTTDASQYSSVGVSNIFVTLGSNPNYNVNTTNSTLTISQASMTITANSTNKTYGTALTLGTGAFTAIGLTNGDTIGVVSLAASGVPTGDTAGATVGSYTITPGAATGGTFTAGNYNISYVAGSLTVTPLMAVLSGTRAYDGTTNAVGTNLTVTNTVNSDMVSLTGTGGLASANVGTNAITSFGSLSLDNGAGTNYSLAGATGAMVITNTPLVIAANDDSQTYSGVSYSSGNGVTYSGFVNGETNTALTGSLSYSGSAIGATTVGTYNITPGGYSSADYLISYVDGTLTISQATPVIGTAPTAGAIIYGQTLGDSALSGGSATPSGGSFAFTAPATVPPLGTASYSMTYTPLDTTNYTVATTTVSVTANPACTAPTIIGGISPASLMATVGDQVVLTLTNVTGMVALAYQWESNSVAIGGATYGSYTNLAVTVADAANYQVIVTNDCGAITSSVVVLTVNPQTPLLASAPVATTTITYGQPLSAAGLTGGVVTNASGTTVPGSFAYTSPGTTPNAGTPSEGVTFTPTDTNNYNSVTTSVIVTVNQALPVVSWGNPADITYGTALSGTQMDATSGGVAGSFTYTPTNGTVLAGGSSQTLSVQFTPTDGANYSTPAVKTATINVLLANQSITFGALGVKTVGDAPFTLGATASSGLAVSYASSVPTVASVSGNTVTILTAGSTTLTASQGGNGDYNAATAVPQTLTVNALPVLGLHASGTNVILSWPTGTETGFGLEAATNLSAPTWVSAGAPTVIGGQYVVTNAVVPNATFYHLKK